VFESGTLGGALDKSLSSHTGKSFFDSAVYVVNLSPTESTNNWSLLLGIKVLGPNDQLLDGSYNDTITITLINV
jgi:hypothetical protein